MTHFNIQNSKIEQISDSGNNYKVSGSNTITENGNVVTASGSQNTIAVDRKESFFTQLWGKIWLGIKRLFGFK